jgi:heat shock protein HslJ
MKTNRIIRTLRQLVMIFPIVISMVITGACQPSDTGEVPPASQAPPPPASMSMDAPSLEELEKTTYVGVINKPVRLNDGRWQDEPVTEGGASRLSVGLDRNVLLSGDLNGDGAKETVVMLWSNSGGSGTFDYLAVVGRSKTGVPVNLATRALGDRVKIHNARVDGGRIVIDSVETGPEDPKCCPGQKYRRTYALAGDTLNEVSATDLGRLSIADLAGAEWVLVEFNWDDPVPADIDITLRFEGDRIGGKSACNQYGGSIIAGRLPGAMTVELPMISTMMACPPPTGDFEQRYLEKLQGVTQFSFLSGNLTLTWRNDESYGTMIFTPQ